MEASVTRDDILNMEAGREMDTLVLTKVMGWHPQWTNECRLDYWIDTEGTSRPLGTSPSTDISDAFEVIKKYKTVWVTKVCGMKGIVWSVRIEDDFVCDFVYAPSAPLAICRAALLAVEVR
jgi:hypothetical protein